LLVEAGELSWLLHVDADLAHIGFESGMHPSKKILE